MNDPRNVLGLTAMFATFSSFFLVCYCANDVILCSRNLITTCFRYELFETDVDFQKSIVLVMARAGKPIAFTAGKMVRLSMELFAQVYVSNHTTYY